ncbi:Squalene--hopene cyclase [Frankliniella fusca]|uniref:Regulatory protein zeste n=1 Tax=Frankliniella fusca TaxID=407009 RepID=A0AAE1HKP8_9NEOP|nr:Squalene--hopene cyclase [Frankliniella fusca]
MNRFAFHPSERQWMALLDAVAMDREMQGEFLGPGAVGRVTAKWETLAAHVNSLGGAFKTGDKWREAFNNLKNRAKRQYADRSRYLRGTGGGPPAPSALGLCPVYQKALNFVQLHQVIGQQGVVAPLQQQQPGALQQQQQQPGFQPQCAVQRAVLEPDPAPLFSFLPDLAQSTSMSTAQADIGSRDLVEAIQLLTATISSMVIAIDTKPLEDAVDKFVKAVETLSKLS